MLVQANQQVTRSWFVGILEGEGSFRRNSNAEVRISNTNLDIIVSCETYLKSNNIWFTRTEHQRANRKKEYMLIVTNSRAQLYPYATLLFDLIKPAMECRCDEYQRILGTPETTCDLSVDLNWLIGIYEAEGSFDLRLNNRGIANLSIQLSNTNLRIIKKVENILAANYCAWFVRDYIKKKEHHSQAHSIQIDGMMRCYRFLSLTQDKWLASRNVLRTRHLMDFINSRSSRPRKEPYNAYELSLIQSVSDLNR